jgi:hypothetical protein
MLLTGPFLGTNPVLRLLPSMTSHELHEQLRRTDEVLARLADFISQQERLVVHLGAEGRPTDHAAGLLTSFREAEAAVAAYRQDLNARSGEDPALPKNEVSDVKSEIPVTYL